ncbi:MAG: type 1 glutamine amidotransferase domain-containing protein [Candidatus Hermodarchaeota archaeon]
MAKIAIIATDGFEEAELIYPYYRLKEAGHESVIISLGRRPIEGKFGYVIKPTDKIDEVSAHHYDGVIIPGGTKNPDYLRRNKQVLEFVHTIDQQNKLVGAICHAGWVLISSKVIRQRKATSYYAIKDDMINAGADFEDSSVVVDGNLITSRMPDDLPDFMREVLRFIRG